MVLAARTRAWPYIHKYSIPLEGAAVQPIGLLYRCEGTLDWYFYFYFFLHLTYSRWISSLPSCLWSQRIFPSLPGSRLTIFLSRCKFSTLTTRQPMVVFYLLTFPRFPLPRKEHKSYFGKNRTHDFRTSRCTGYLLDHSGDERRTSTALSKIARHNHDDGIATTGLRSPFDLWNSCFKEALRRSRRVLIFLQIPL